MKELDDLNQMEKTVLLIFCYRVNFSLSAHLPRQGIVKNIGKSLAKGVKNGKYVKKAFQELLKNRFIKSHPAGRNMTFDLTKKGLQAGIMLKNEI